MTALATGFAMKYRYEAMVHFRNTYTYQFLSEQKELDKTIRPLIEKDNQVAYEAQIPILLIDNSMWDTKVNYGNYSIIAYSQLKQLVAAD